MRGLWLVLISWIAVQFTLRPIQGVPFIDDWVYASTVEHLLRTGRLEMLDYSGNMTYAQAMWGALFCLPFGFSLEALRVSTFVLAAATLAGMHRLAREAGATPGAATLATAVVAVYPPFVVLSNSFMTEVPLLAAETWALVYFVRGMRQCSMRHIWCGVVMAALGGATRYVGLVPAIAASAALLFDGRGWGRQRGRWLAPLTSLVVVAVLASHYASHVRHVADVADISLLPAGRLQALRESGLALLPSWLPLSLEFTAVQLGLVLVPLAAAVRLLAADRRRLAMLAAAGAVVASMGFATGLHNLAFTSEGTWLSDELGGVLTLLPGYQAIVVPLTIAIAMTALCWMCALAAGAVALRPDVREPADAVLWWTVTGLVLLTALLWLTTDRYILPFLPAALALVARGARPVSWPRAALPLALYAAIGVAGVRDRAAAERAIWSALADLRAQGVPVAEIDAGYAVNGWLQYAHPDDARRDATGGIDVPYVNSDTAAPWVVAATALPGTTVAREYVVPRTWRTPASILVLRR